MESINKEINVYSTLETKDIDALIKQLPVNFFCIDVNGYCTGYNQRMLDTLGLENSKEYLGVHSSSFGKKVWENCKDVIKKQKTVTLEECGKGKTYLTVKAPHYNKEKKIVGVIGISLDISDRKLAEKQLLLEKEKAEAANKAMQAFLENMRHDLRTALNGIEGNAQLIQDKTVDPALTEYVENLVISARVLTSIQNQVLNATRVFSGDVPFYKKKFHWQSRLQQIIDLNRAKAQSKHLKLTLDYDKTIPDYLVGDCKRLSIVALELLTNALKYTDKGRVIVQTTLHKQEGRDVFLKLSVIDTGIGISKDKQEEIFMRFRRLTPSYEGKYQGLGLGLSVVKQFIDELDAEIYVESELNKGTTFTCYIPMKESISNNNQFLDDTGDLFPSHSLDIDALMRSVQSKEISTQSPTQETAKKSRVLLVEDQPIALQIATGLLTNLQCVVDSATTGQAAIDKALSHDYDIIFMDVGLPDKDGNEVTRQIRLAERGTSKHVPIIALTAHIDSESKKTCVEAGMDAVLNKPLIKAKAADTLNAFIPARSQSIAQTKEAVAPEEKSLFELTGKVVDLAMGAELIGDDETMAHTMIQNVLDDYDTQETDLDKAYDQKDWDTMQAIIHRVRGGMVYCGMPRVSMAANHLENYLKAEKTKLITKLYDQFREELNAVRSELL